jgi:hypothetical protein
MDLATQTHLTTLRALLTYRLRDLRAAPGDGDAGIDQLAEVEAALDRLDNGTYGDCVDCGEPVTLQRLLVQPAAQRCALCAAEQARGRRFRLYS